MLALCIEASHARGMGHLYRALALNAALRQAGADSEIFLNNWEPALDILRTREAPFQIVPLDESDWDAEIVRRRNVHVWVDDRLDTTAAHAQRVRAAGARLATFDDHGPGAEFADIQVAALSSGNGQPPAGAKVLTGMNYVVLDAAIAPYRHLRSQFRSLVVSMGGSDTYGVTVDIVRALKARGRKATVILGPGFAHEAALSELPDKNFVVKRAVPSLAEEFSRHDLAITAGGITPCEANAAGLPCIIVATEPWETPTARLLERLGGSIFAGMRDCIDFTLLDRDPEIATMSQAALDNVPCNGAERVVQALLAL